MILLLLPIICLSLIIVNRSVLLLGAAWAMLGKAYMAAPEETGLRDFCKADECFKTIINMGRYELLNDYADLYRYDNPNTKSHCLSCNLIMYIPDCNYWEFDCGSRACDSWFGQGCSFSGPRFSSSNSFCL